MVDEASNAQEELVFLIGRPPIGEYLGFVATQTVGGESLGRAALMGEWRAANDHIRQIEAAESGLADGFSPMQLSADLSASTESLLTDPRVRETFGAIPCSLGVVELDRLVVYQKQINLTFVGELLRRLPADPSRQAIFDFCLPRSPILPSVRADRIARNVFAFNSLSTDFRFLDVATLKPEEIVNNKKSGHVAAVVGLVVGFGVNLLNVVAVENRAVLHNGSHRAYALRSAGITHAPSLIQHVTRREELELVGGPLHEQPDLYLKAARPPLLKDYFDPKLRKVLAVPKKLRQVRVTFGIETLDIPQG